MGFLCHPDVEWSVLHGQATGPCIEEQQRSTTFQNILFITLHRNFLVRRNEISYNCVIFTSIACHRSFALTWTNSPSN